MLQNVTLTDFRNFSKKKFDIDQNVTIIEGVNTAGKTSILEAIILLATGKSFRAIREQEMIRDGCPVGRVNAQLVEEDKLEIVITNGSVLGKTTPHKLFKINGVGKRMADFIQEVDAVLFWPEDLELIIGSPSTRRHYIDTVLSQADIHYFRSLTHYEKALRIRNRLLFQKREGLAISPQEMVYWEEQLIEHGTFLHNQREVYVQAVNAYNSLDHDFHFSIVYDHSIISPERLERYRTVELQTGTTVVGPHRDDLIINKLSQKNTTSNLHAFGSRGEQRLGVLWLKMAELDYLTKARGQKPLLLLDDILSELDKDHRDLVLKVMSNQQTIMTTTDQSFIPARYRNNVQIIMI